MDRFIVGNVNFLTVLPEHLKSNMDRFIAESFQEIGIKHGNLKSNMDRFIDVFGNNRIGPVTEFKIQYG